MTDDNDRKFQMILDKLNGMERWQSTHETTHKQIDRDVRELRGETYGSGTKDGLKTRMQAVEYTTQTYPTWMRFFLNVLEKLVTAGLIFIGGILLMSYQRTS